MAKAPDAPSDLNTCPCQEMYADDHQFWTDLFELAEAVGGTMFQVCRDEGYCPNLIARIFMMGALKASNGVIEAMELTDDMFDVQMRQMLDKLLADRRAGRAMAEAEGAAKH